MSYLLIELVVSHIILGIKGFFSHQHVLSLPNLHTDIKGKCYIACTVQKRNVNQTNTKKRKKKDYGL